MTNKEILEIFGEYEKVKTEIAERVYKGEFFGSMEWFFYKEDYEVITDEMEKVFNGEDVASITIEWGLNFN